MLSKKSSKQALNSIYALYPQSVADFDCTFLLVPHLCFCRALCNVVNKKILYLYLRKYTACKQLILKRKTIIKCYNKNMNKKFINSQGLKPYADIKFGLLTFKRNGCGPIAIYNLLLRLNSETDLKKIISDIKRFLPLSVDGLLGTSVIAVLYCLKINGIRTKVVPFPFLKRAEKYLKKHGCGILMYFHGKGSHYVCVQHNKYNDGKFTVYNRSNSYPFETKMDSLEFLYKMNKVFIPLLLFVPINSN